MRQSELIGGPFDGDVMDVPFPALVVVRAVPRRDLGHYDVTKPVQVATNRREAVYLRGKDGKYHFDRID